MRAFVNTLVKGQTAMLKTKRDIAVVFGLVVLSILLTALGVLTLNMHCFASGVSLAVIDLAIAYMMGRRAQ